LKVNKSLIIGILSIAFLTAALLILYAEIPQKININSCSREALVSLPDIGPVLADRIINGRPYVDIWSLDKVKGIGPDTIDAIRNKVTVKDW